MANQRKRRELQRQQRQQATLTQAAAGPTTLIAATQFQFNQASLVPMAEELARLEQINPGLAERAFSMAERQQEHRHKLEAAAITGGIARASRGQWMTFVLGLVAVGGGVYLAANNQPTLGITSILGTLAVLGGVFIYGRRAGGKELAEKDPTGPQQSRKKR